MAGAPSRFHTSPASVIQRLQTLVKRCLNCITLEFHKTQNQFGHPNNWPAFVTIFYPIRTLW